MKIIHCSDLHLDSPMRYLTAEKARVRRAELFQAFSDTLAFAREHSVRAVLVAGDLFDSDSVSISVKKSVEDLIRAYGDILFFYVSGNHDFKSGFFENDAPKNFKTAKSGGGFFAYDLEGGVTVALIDCPPDSPAVYEGLSLDRARRNIVVMHGEASEYLKKDGAATVRLAYLRERNIDYLALGHYHDFFAARLDGRGEYVYSGCLAGRGFDECGQKGFVLLDIDEKGVLSQSFVPLAGGREFFTVEAVITGCGSMYAVEAAALSALNGIAPQNAVKVVLTGRAHKGLRKDLRALGEQLSRRFFFAKVADESRLDVSIAEYEGDVSLKGEFVRLVLRSDLDEREKEEIAACGLRYLEESSASSEG
ncbi:MAG: metallophosphoesterase [Clostridiales bacterium]|jgi:DNA repair exonuclease SbcCD nuclease subunit|nr:metallophosphoesterase [Clostridiales bacterium]